MNAGEWTLRSRRVVTPSGIVAADVLIRNEAIAGLLQHDGPESEGVILDAGDMAVLPGLVFLDREGPGASEGRGLDAATRESAEGGVTTLIGLPSCREAGPATTSSFLRRMVATEGKMRVDCGLIVPLGRGNAARVESWIEAGVVGVEAFLDEGDPGSPPASTDADLHAAMPTLAKLGRPLIVHSGRIGRKGGRSGSGDSLPDREFEAIRLLIRLCRETRCRVHLIHPSTTEALPMIAAARADRLPITVEAGPRHLGLEAPRFVDGVPTYQLDPRRRGADARDRLWEALGSGLVDAIGPDHAREGPPAALDPVDEPLPLRLALPSAWTEARRRGFTLEHLGRWLSTRAAQAVGLSSRKGSIASGLDADLIVFDPDAPPGFGDEPPRPRPPGLTGRVEATILRGALIYQGGQFVQQPRGNLVLRLEETQPIAGTDA